MFLSVFALAFGAFFLFYGIRIACFGRYDLLSGYTPDKGEAYAIRAGWTHIIGGFLCLAAGGIGLAFPDGSLPYILFFSAIAIFILLSTLNDKTAGR